MNKSNLLRVAQNDEGGGGDPADDGQQQPPPDTKKPADKKSAVDVVKTGKKTPREIQLEVANAKLEDELTSTKAALDEVNALIEAAQQAPGRNKGKSMLDDLKWFMETKPKKPATSAAAPGALDQVNEILGL